MEGCDSRTRAYKNGRTFDQCKAIAKETSLQLAPKIEENGDVSWKEILEAVGHDELVYKLTLKFLRLDGYNIGDWKNPKVARAIG